MQELAFTCCSLSRLTVINLRVDKTRFGDKQNPPVKLSGWVGGVFGFFLLFLSYFLVVAVVFFRLVV